MRRILLFLFFAGTLSVLSAQDGPSYGNPEEGFSLMRSLAQAGEYDSARQIGYSLLDEVPAYHDVSLYLARIYGWEGNFDSAYQVVDRVMLADPLLAEATQVCAALAYWNEDQERLDHCKSRAVAIDSSLAGEFEKYEAEAETEEGYAVFGFYSYDHFSLPYVRNWHMLSLGVEVPLEPFKLIPSVNMGYHAGGYDPATDLQLNLDAYWTISKMNYAMLSYGFSPNGSIDYFPGHRAAAEFWQGLPLDFTISAGLRYFYWDEHFPFLTFSLEKYLGNYWLSFRNYLFFKDYGASGSYYLSARRYFDNARSYLGVTLGFGAAPDEPTFIVSDLDRLSAISIRLDYSRQLSQKVSLGAGLGYSREEYSPDMKRNRFDFRIGAFYSIAK